MFVVVVVLIASVIVFVFAIVKRCSIVKHAVDAAWQLLQKSLLSIYVLYLHAPVRVMFAKLF